MAFDPKPHLITLPRRVKDPETGQWTTRLSLYLEVKYRVVMFRERYPHGAIDTEEICCDLERGYARYKATVTDGQGGRATGYGTETKADFTDYAERAETRAIGRALALLGFGTPFAGEDLTEGDHVADAPMAAPNGHPPAGQIECSGLPEDPAAEASRLTTDQARRLKQLAQQAFGYREGERRLRQDLGFEVDEKLTLRHLAAHVSVVQAQPLMAAYEAALRQSVEQALGDGDIPDAAPPALTTSAEG